MTKNEKIVEKPENSGKNEKRGLTPKQLKAAAYLGQGLSQTKTAELVGVTTRTIYNWNEELDFLTERERQTKKAIYRITRQSPSWLEAGINHLLKNLNDNDCSSTIQFQSAKALIEEGKNHMEDKPSLQEIAIIPASDSKPDSDDGLDPIARGRRDGIRDLESSIYNRSRLDPFNLDANLLAAFMDEEDKFMEVWHATNGLKDLDANDRAKAQKITKAAEEREESLDRNEEPLVREETDEDSHEPPVEPPQSEEGLDGESLEPSSA